MKAFFKVFAALLLAFTTVSISTLAHENEVHNQTLTISNAWAPHTGKRTMSAAVYLTLHNDATTVDTLIDVKSDIARMTTLHHSYEKNTVMRMDHVDRLDLPAQEIITLSPGGYHIMLMSLDAPLKRGEYFPLTLVFEKAGPVQIMVEITGIGGPE